MSNLHSVPPYTNRGAQNTNEIGLIACVDWLQVTFRHVRNPHEIIDLLGLEHDLFTAFENGKYGYSFHVRFGHIAIYYSEDTPSVHLEITGQGCREYEQYGKYEWSILFGLILMLDVNVTRLDLAIDDYKGYFKISTLYRKLKATHARSKFKSFRYMVQQKISEKEITGQTVYLGSPSSRLMIRFYDKLAERKNKNYEIKDGVTFWNRTELQLRDERAKSAAELIATEKYNVGQMVQGILRNYILFVNPTKLENGEIDKNKGRWKVADFWEKFLGEVEKIPLTEKAPDQTIEKVKTWFEHNMTPTFSMLLEAFDYDRQLLEQWVREGSKKHSKRHENMLQRFKEEKQRIEKINKLKKEKLQDKLLEPRKLIKEQKFDREKVYLSPDEVNTKLMKMLNDRYEFIIKKDLNQNDLSQNTQN